MLAAGGAAGPDTSSSRQGGHPGNSHRANNEVGPIAGPKQEAMKHNLFIKTKPGSILAPQNRNPDNLTDAKLETMCRDRPRDALKHAADRLTAAQIETCRQVSPAKTLLYAASRLPQEQLVETAVKCGPKIKAVLGHQPNHPMAKALFQVIDRLDAKTAHTVKKAMAAASSKQ